MTALRHPRDATGRRAARGACALLAAVATSATPPPAAGTELDVEGLLAARGVASQSRSPWTAGGFGRFTVGAEAPGERSEDFVGKAHLGLDLWLTDTLRLRAQGLARLEDARSRGEAFGLTEAFLEFTPSLSFTTSLRLRAGLLFPGTSRENKGPLWSSPYTITLSALNTWTVEELRLLGVEARLLVETDLGDEFVMGATAFGGADPAGTLLAWRGWSMGDRLAVVGEFVPLPPLASFRPGRGFVDQRAEGTRPIDELDDRVGWMTLARYQRFDTVTLQGAYFDSRGDRLLWDGQYAWETRFAVAGADLHLGPVVLVGEFLWGDSRMGRPGGSNVRIRMRAGYALASWATEKTTLTLRYDHFENDDLDRTEEPNDDDGSAWTAAFFWSPNEHLRIGVEHVELSADDRAAAAASGFDPDTDGRRTTVEVRFGF